MCLGITLYGENESEGFVMSISRMEMVVLAIWGCPDYASTITRLANVTSLTVDKDARRLIAGLHDYLLTESTADEYKELYKRSTDHCIREILRKLSGKQGRIREIQRAKAIAESRGWMVVDSGSTK